ncbi:MAG TPA: HEAT repeat domain-containing protein [Pyrinomonadaceae bacterium]|nr:HEAT repeat domain-containing protein [Pyrinomonadaceae bacterium]
MNQQVKARLSAVRDFLSGRSAEAKLAGANDQATREVVGAELLSAMSGRNADDASRETTGKPASVDIDTQEIPRLDAAGDIPEVSKNENDEEQIPQSATGSTSVETELSENLKEQEQERARMLFMDHGYFDEAVQNLRAAKSPADRASAARALGLFGSPRGTAHLIAAMFDEDPEVCSAAEEALGRIGDPVAQASLAAALNNEAENVAETTGENEGAASQIDAGASQTNLMPAQIEPGEVESLNLAGEELEVSQAVATADGATDALGSIATEEENQLLQEEQAIRDTLEELGRQVVETIAALKEAENEVRWRIEREGQLRAEAAEKFREEAELRKQADEEAEERRVREREAVAVEQAARVKAESEGRHYADEQTSLRLKAAGLRLSAEEIGRRRLEIETERHEAAQAARQAEATRARDESKARHEAELKRLRSEEEALLLATNEVALQQAQLKAAREKAASETERLKKEQAAVEAAQRAEADRLRSEAEERNRQAEEQLRVQLEALRHADEEVDARRAEVEAARAKADTEAERLVEAHARMRAAEEARAQAEVERSQLEAEINLQVETQRRLLEETRRRGEEEHERMQEETRRQAEAEKHRLAELEVMKARAEVESTQRAEKEQQILSQIDSLRISDAETRRRIEDAEVRRRSAEDAYRLVAEKVQRVEAEAHARAKEEERILTKLEAERRTVALEAQSRAEQEKRIKEEIEMFRRLEEQERPRIEEATLQLAAAAARLEERKDRLRENEEDRLLVEDRFNRVDEQREISTEPARQITRPEGGIETAGANERTSAMGAASIADEDILPRNEIDGSAVTPAIANFLSSVDPYKRAAAVAELARSGGPDAFSQIVDSFDDSSPHVRNAAARALRKLEPDRTVDLFNRALEEASAERRRNIGGAIAASGLATEAINNLASVNRQDTYTALSILFVMAKTGEVEPLVRALAEHPTDEIGKAVTKLLTLSGHSGNSSQ